MRSKAIRWVLAALLTVSFICGSIDMHKVFADDGTRPKPKCEDCY